MARHGPGLPLPQGLRVVGGAKELTGWQVAAKKGHRQHVPLGTVQQVDSVQAAGQRGPSYQLLRVVQQAVLQPYGFRGQEVHLLPLVPDIITALHPEQQLLVADPPEGLLDMGRRDLLLSFLSQALLPYAPLAQDRPAAAAAGLMAGARALTQVREMPTRQQLLDAGRADLVNLVMKVGGFTQAALQLGMRATRRPAGYWSSLEVLDMELDAFIAGCWVALPCPEDDDTGDEDQQQQQQQQQQPQQPQDVYYYNTATKSIRWSLPDELQAVLAPQDPHHNAAPHPSDPAAAAASQPAAAVAGDPGDTAAAAGLSPAAYQALLDLHEERVMPPVSAITAAGRWDLHNAITRNGGYTAVAAELDRRLSRALPAELTTPEGLKAALKGVCWEEGWDSGALPTAQQLRDADRTDLVRAITQLGGWGAAAQALGLTSVHSTSTAWHSWTLTDLAQELSVFMAQHSSAHQPTGPAASPAAPGEGSPSYSDDTVSAASSRQRLSSLLRRRKQQQQQQQQAQDTNTQQAGPQQQSPEQPLAGSTARASLPPPLLLPAPKQQQQQHGAGSLPYLPTQAQLLAAGRVDLVYALRQHGYEAVRRHMQLPARYSRPKQKGVLQWAQVEAAVAAGCHTCKDILQHISTQHQQQLTAAQAQAHAQQPTPSEPDSSDSAAAAGTAPGADGVATGQKVIVPVVSREHLQRQLKAWVEEGRLVKAARNCFTLPEEPA